MKLLGKYIRSYLKETVLAPLFKMLEAALELIIPILVAKIIDEGIPSGDSGFIIRYGVLMIVLGAGGFASSVLAQYFAARSAANTGADLRRDLFAHINGLSYKEIDSIGTSSLITRMTSDINQVQYALNMFLRLFLRSPFIVAGATVCAFIIGRRTDIVFGVTVPALFAFIFIILIITMPLNAKVQQVLEKLTRQIRENISGVRVVRAFNRQEDEKDEFAVRSGELFKRQLFSGGVSGLLNPLSYAAINIAIVLIIYIGGGEVDEGAVSRGAVVALVNYMSQILVELIKLANLIILESKGLASLQRINALFKIENSMKDGTLELAAADGAWDISLEHVSFGYGEGAEPAVDDVTVRIKQGQTAGIIGGTGSGKSTLAGLILRLYDADSGVIRVNGREIKEYTKDSIVENSAFVPQKAALFSGTLKENLQIGGKTAGEDEMYEALETAQALDFVKEKGKGLDLEIEEGGTNLSGGQKQRLTIARALVKKAGLLIMDDSSSALDYATDAALRSAVKNDGRKRTTVIISQRIATVRDADVIIVMDAGRVAGTGTHDELVKSCPVYQEICATQLGEEAACV